LRVEMRLRPLLVALGRDEALLDEIDARGLHRPVDLRPVRGASARHLVDHIDGIAPAHEILRPALAAVGRAGEVGAGLAAAMHHHDRIGMAATRRDHVLDVDMPDRGAAFGRAVDLAADEEIARARKREWPALLRPGERRRQQHRRYHHRGRNGLAAKSEHAFLRHVSVRCSRCARFRL
jgi:hypothetical protein